MFAKFKLELINEDLQLLQYLAELTKKDHQLLHRLYSGHYLMEGKQRDLIFENYSNEMEAYFHHKIEQHLFSDGNLDAEAIEKEWFPEIDAQVFISYSSSDKRWAKYLAKWLYVNYGIKSFVDSMVWDHVNNLLKNLECPIIKNNAYDYNALNQVSAHVHMILSTAITKMINKSECFIFIKTPNSIVNEDKTPSPWIYHELSMAKYLPQIEPIRMRNRGLVTEDTKCASLNLIQIFYHTPLEDLKSLTIKDIMAAGQGLETMVAEAVLDQLYRNKRVPNAK